MPLLLYSSSDLTYCPRAFAQEALPECEVAFAFPYLIALHLSAQTPIPSPLGTSSELSITIGCHRWLIFSFKLETS